MALFDVMVLHGNSYHVVVAIKDCTGHLCQAGKKDALLFIADVFSKLLLEFDAEANRVDIFYFDGASNVQKAGELLGVKFPRTATYHGGEHVVAMWFSDRVKILVIKVFLHCSYYLFCFLVNFCTSFPHFSQKLILKVCRCYNIVCSGANQALYAIFLAYSKKVFGTKLSLL